MDIEETEAERAARIAMDRHIDTHNEFYSSFAFNINSMPYFNSDFWRFFVITINFLGIQFAWSVELSYGTPYLLSLGITKSMMLLVWLAGPLSGFIMQPLIGAISDRCESSWGRRRPFMLTGMAGVIVGLLMIGWTKELLKELNLDFKTHSPTVAVVAFFLPDFAINAIMACSRALIVDILPPSHQELGNAWAARMVGAGNIIGYLMGYLNLPKIFPMFGKRQLQVLCGLAIVILSFTVGLTCGSVKERQWIKDDPNAKFSLYNTLFGPLVKIYRALTSLKKTIKWLCITQFFSWIGWFPFLFYATSWITELGSVMNKDNTMDQNTRLGSRAFLFFSCMSLLTTFVVQYFLKSSQAPLANSTKVGYTLSLPQWFTTSLILFGVLMLLPLIFDMGVVMATVLVTMCGISNALSMWAPFSIIGEELRASSNEYIPLDNMDNNPPRYSISEDRRHPEDTLEAGVVLGIHNLFIVVPQIIISLISSVLFNVLEPKNQYTSYSPTVVIFALGGVSSLVAALISYKIWRLK